MLLVLNRTMSVSERVLLSTQLKDKKIVSLHFIMLSVCICMIFQFGREKSEGRLRLEAYYSDFMRRLLDSGLERSNVPS